MTDRRTPPGNAFPTATVLALVTLVLEQFFSPPEACLVTLGLAIARACEDGAGGWTDCLGF